MNMIFMFQKNCATFIFAVFFKFFVLLTDSNNFSPLQPDMIGADIWNKLSPHLNCIAALPCKVRASSLAHIFLLR